MTLLTRDAINLFTSTDHSFCDCKCSHSKECVRHVTHYELNNSSYISFLYIPEDKIHDCREFIQVKYRAK